MAGLVRGAESAEKNIFSFTAELSSSRSAVNINLCESDELLAGEGGCDAVQKAHAFAGQCTLLIRNP